MASNKLLDLLTETLRDFKEEHQLVGDAVNKVEQMMATMLGTAPAKRRGRPPGKKTEQPATKTGKRGRRTWTAAQKKAQGEKLRAAWAKRKKGE